MNYNPLTSLELFENKAPQHRPLIKQVSVNKWKESVRQSAWEKLMFSNDPEHTKKTFTYSRVNWGLDNHHPIFPEAQPQYYCHLLRLHEDLKC